MRVLLSRVDSASCEVDGEIISKIEKGLLLIVGFGVDDDEEIVKKLAAKIGKIRVFPDEDGKIRLSTADVGGSALVISNFTLYGSVRRSYRPDFSKSCPGDRAREYFELFKKELSAYFPVQSGRFAAHMHISALHDGPVNLIIDSAELCAAAQA